MPATTGSLRFMIVDDEVIVAMDLADMLHDLGHSVVATANRVDKGMELARQADLDMAILDINVHDAVSFPIATVLSDRGVPVIFASGYGERGLIDGFRHAHVLTKPYGLGDLAQLVAKVRLAAA